jgi:hypothetical protein
MTTAHYEGDPADLIADAKKALFRRILALVPAGIRVAADQLLTELLDLAEENLTAEEKTGIARIALGLPPAWAQAALDAAPAKGDRVRYNEQGEFPETGDNDHARQDLRPRTR